MSPRVTLLYRKCSHLPPTRKFRTSSHKLNMQGTTPYMHVAGTNTELRGILVGFSHFFVGLFYSLNAQCHTPWSREIIKLNRM
jgi:hypothetical protein